MVDLRYNGDSSSLHSDVVAMFLCQKSPVPLLLLLPQFREEKRDDQQPDDDGHHAQGQRQTQRPVDRVVAGAAPVAELTLTHQVAAAAGRHHAGTVTIAPSLSTGGQAVVNASPLRSRKGGGHRHEGSAKTGGNSGKKQRVKTGTVKLQAVEFTFYFGCCGAAQVSECGVCALEVL